jgi:hypothetical protein
MKLTKGEIEGVRSHIEVPQGHEPPKVIEGTEPKKRKPPPHGRKKSPSHVLVAQSAYQETILKKERGRLVIDKLPDDWPDGTPLPDNVTMKFSNQPKQTIKEKAMSALLNQLIAFLKTWLYGRPVYKTVTNAKGEIEFVLNEDGNKIMNLPLTILGRVLQVLGALGLLTSAIWGKTVGEWGDIVKGILAIVGG